MAMSNGQATGDPGPAVRAAEAWTTRGDAARPAPAGDMTVEIDVDDRPLDELVADLYDAVRRLAGSKMRHEPLDGTLQATAVVHEAYVRLAGQRNTRYRSQEHFLAVTAMTIRRILVDQARRRRARPVVRTPDGVLDEAGVAPAGTGLDLLDLESALERLEKLDERKSRVVTMRFFGGMSMEAIAVALGVSRRTVQEDWTFARSWIRVEIDEGHP